MARIKDKVYILVNNYTGNLPGVFEDVKTVKSVRKRMDQTESGMYSILEAEIIGEIK